MPETRVGVTVEGRNESHAALAAALNDTKLLANEIRRLQREGDGTAKGNSLLANTYLDLKFAQGQVVTLSKQLSQENTTLATGHAKLVQSLEDVTRHLVAHTGPAGMFAASLGHTALGVAALAGALAVGTAALFASARGIADYQEQLDVTAKSLGFTTGQLAGLKIAASESGRSFEQVRPGLDFFARRIGEATSGSKEATEAFINLGVSIRDSSDQIRPTGDIFRDVQASLNEIEAPAERARKAFEVFGRGSTAYLAALLIPIDAVESRARKLGLALGPDAEAVARRADVAFDSLATSMRGLANAFGVIAVSAIGHFIEELARAASEVAEFMNRPEVQAFFNLGILSPEGTARSIAARAAAAGMAAPTQESIDVQRGRFTLGPGESRSQSAEVRASHLKRIAAEQEIISAAQKAASDLEKAFQVLVASVVGGGVGIREAFEALKTVEQRRRFQTIVEREFGVVPESLFRPIGEERPFGPSPFREPRLFPGGRPEAQMLPEGRVGFAEDMFTVFEEFMASFADGAEIIRETADAQGQVNEAAAAYTAVMREQEPEWVKAVRRAEEMRAALASFSASVQGAFSQLVKSAILNLQSLDDAFRSLFQSIASALLDLGVKALISVITAPVGGGEWTGMAGVMQSGGTVVSGIRGRDTNAALLGRGETVLDHSLTDALKSLIPRLDRFVSIPQSRPAQTSAIEVNLYVDDRFRDGENLRALVRNHLIPEIRTALASGAHR